MAALVIERSYVDLKSQVTINGVCYMFASDVKYLVSDHSTAKVWSAGHQSFALWYVTILEIMLALHFFLIKSCHRGSAYTSKIACFLLPFQVQLFEVVILPLILALTFPCCEAVCLLHFNRAFHLMKAIRLGLSKADGYPRPGPEPVKRFWFLEIKNRSNRFQVRFLK